VERRAALQLFPTDLAAIARAFTLGVELTRSVRRQRGIALLSRVGQPLCLLGALALGARGSLPAIGFLLGLAEGVALLISALSVASARPEEDGWTRRL
jgi:hypothetical protein